MAFHEDLNYRKNLEAKIFNLISIMLIPFIVILSQFFKLSIYFYRSQLLIRFVSDLSQNFIHFEKSRLSRNENFDSFGSEHKF